MLNRQVHHRHFTCQSCGYTEREVTGDTGKKCPDCSDGYEVVTLLSCIQPRPEYQMEYPDSVTYCCESKPEFVISIIDDFSDFYVTHYAEYSLACTKCKTKVKVKSSKIDLVKEWNHKMSWKRP